VILAGSPEIEEAGLGFGLLQVGHRVQRTPAVQECHWPLTFLTTWVKRARSL
jgi:hypothetical protein